MNCHEPSSCPTTMRSPSFNLLPAQSDHHPSPTCNLHIESVAHKLHGVDGAQPHTRQGFKQGPRRVIRCFDNERKGWDCSDPSSAATMVSVRPFKTMLLLPGSFSDEHMSSLLVVWPSSPFQEHLWHGFFDLEDQPKGVAVIRITETHLLIQGTTVLRTFDLVLQETLMPWMEKTSLNLHEQTGDHTHKSSFRALYSMVREEHKDPAVYKLICAGPEERTVSLDIIGMGSDEVIQGFAVLSRWTRGSMI
ncbi:hypothetical protein BDZ97DRAFT_2071114 [Flammula alnicola]|nr:hypothetical protein BDZ97DRAFT_2071114 [Flammula alnicola]